MEVKISQLPALVGTLDDTAIIPITFNGVTYKVTRAELAQGLQPVQSINQVTLQGVNDNTTARLYYGINVISIANNSNFCARLPLTPIEGKSVTVVNNGVGIARIFPSVPGGDINGSVNGYVDVPPDHKATVFVCWDNPNPGSWSVTARTLVSTILIGEMSVSHTTGTTTTACGNAQFQASSVGAATAGGSLIFTPSSSYFRTEANPTTATKINVRTNIIAGNAGDFNNRISIGYWQVYKDGTNSVQTGPRTDIKFDSTGYGVNIVPAGAASNTPALVGDAGTFYGDSLVLSTGVSNQIGSGGQYSPYYYYIAINIPAVCATKNYKFQVEIEYV